MIRTRSTIASPPSRSAAPRRSASLRGGKEVKLTVALETAPDTPRDEIVITARSPFPGVKVANISPALADEMRLDAATEGVVVLDVAERLAGAEPRLPEGRRHRGGQQREDRAARAISNAPREGIARAAVAHHAGARRARQIHRHSSADEPRRDQTRAAKPVRSRRARAGCAASARRPAAPDAARRSRRAGSSARPRRRAHAHAGDALARLAGLLGTARHRQDHGGAAAGGCDRAAFRADFRGVLRRRRPEEGVRGGARAARDRAGHAAVRRRGASLQPRAAGFVSCR